MYIINILYIDSENSVNHLQRHGSVRTLQNTTLEDFLRRKTKKTKDGTHVVQILAGGGVIYDVPYIMYVLIKNNMQCSIFILIVVVHIYSYGGSSVNCKQASTTNLPKSSTTKKLDTVADESRKKMAYTV